MFWFNELLITSNGTDSRVRSLTEDWERFGDKVELAIDGEMLLGRGLPPVFPPVQCPPRQVISIGKVAAPANKVNGTVALFIKID